MAAALDTYVRALFEAENGPEAVAAVQEAVVLRRQLLVADSDGPADLSGALMNLACLLGGIGWRQQAYAAIQESVDICRRLADIDPYQYMKLLAAGLRVGWIPQGLATGMDAIAEYEQLVQVEPAAYLRISQKAMHNHSLAPR